MRHAWREMSINVGGMAAEPYGAAQCKRCGIQGVYEKESGIKSMAWISDASDMEFIQGECDSDAMMVRRIMKS